MEIFIYYLQYMSHFRIAILCGGPSPERGISLNSARSVLDHLSGDGIEIVPIYFDQRRNPFLISTGQLYSNTPSDFDFRLEEIAKPLSPRQFENELKRCHLVYPVMHGYFGEDGDIQKLLEEIGVPFVGSSSEACKRCFDKNHAKEFLEEHGFDTVPQALLRIYKEDHAEIINEFFRRHNVSRAVVKPATGGSSIGVYSVSSPTEALEKSALLFSKRMDSRVVVEPFVEGIEFTVIILQNSFGLPVALIPTEIEADYEQNQIFDYRKKYLPTRQVTFHCPPRFSDEIVEKIQVQAEQLFSMFGMQDCARFDGWVLPNGEIRFTDFNPVSGMEQNSFLFQQGARVGLTHRSLLRYIVENACRRNNLTTLPPMERSTGAKKVAVVFGGDTSERQVSLMSGTNVWLKLLRSKEFIPHPYLMESNGMLLEAPYALLLNHTVEEVIEACRTAEIDEKRLRRFERSAQLRLAIPKSMNLQMYFPPQRRTLEEVASENEFVFIALHGGKGEDGTIQNILDDLAVPYNGAGAKASALCMDKFLTGEAISSLEKEGILSSPKEVIQSSVLLNRSKSQLEKFWQFLMTKFGKGAVVVKPQADGCSSGIVRLGSLHDLQVYLNYLKAGISRIPAGHFDGQADPVEMPSKMPEQIMFEPFVITDRIKAVSGELKLTEKSGWIEVTVGVLEENGKLRALSPSLTIAEGEVLTLEEKFQGGTGINITPPPKEILSKRHCELVKKRIELVAKTLGVRGYARIDAFVERKTGRVLIIEANTLPGLTPSTVLFHQGIAEESTIDPADLLEKIIEAGFSAFAKLVPNQLKEAI